MTDMIDWKMEAERLRKELEQTYRGCDELREQFDRVKVAARKCLSANPANSSDEQRIQWMDELAALIDNPDELARNKRLERVDAALAKRLADVLKENFAMEIALKWYQCEAEAAAKYMIDKNANADALTAILTVLALDGGARARAAREQFVANEVWQPIDTAPKDGTRVLIYTSTNDTVVDSRWFYDEVTGNWGWVNSFIGFGREGMNASHWAPFSPPQNTA